ncbi:MAG: hypothetical protein GY835_07195 [bacterium]|nr:hypothetical protein [bacterium]
MPLVPTPRKTQMIWLVLIACLAVLILLSAVISIDDNVSGVCELSPATMWTLSERRVGSYESKTVNLVSGEILQYRIYQFDRPACLDMDLGGTRDTSGNMIPVHVGQTVLTMKSSDLELEMAERTTALAEARSLLLTLQGGAKPEEIRHTTLGLERSRAELEAFSPQYERQQQLFADGIISDRMWEETSTQYRLLQMDISLGEASLDVISSDARPEDIAAAEASIEALENELIMVENMLSAQEIHSPISGYMHVNPDSGLVLSVADIDTLIVKMLIPQHVAFKIKRNQELRVAIPGAHSGLVDGHVLRIDPNTLVTATGAFVVVYGLIDNSSGLLTYGMQGRSRIYCGESTILTRIKSNLQQAMNKEFLAL